MSNRTLSALVFTFYVVVALFGAYGFYNVVGGISNNARLAMENRELIKENHELIMDNHKLIKKLSSVINDLD